LISGFIFLREKASLSVMAVQSESMFSGSAISVVPRGVRAAGQAGGQLYREQRHSPVRGISRAGHVAGRRHKGRHE
jgi:hypothetical protein